MSTAPKIKLEDLSSQEEKSNFSAQLKELEPRINYHLNKQGLGGDPLAKGQAKILASRALKSYDPSKGASFDTWLDRSMMPLTRFRRQRSSTIRVPEKMQLDNLEIKRAEIDFEERHGRLPEMDELADASGMTLKRLASIRKTIRPLTGEDTYEGSVPSSLEPDIVDEAMSSVWQESDKLDRRILEMKTGFGGRYQKMKSADVARELNLTPVQLSRKSARIYKKMDEILEELQKK